MNSPNALSLRCSPRRRCIRTRVLLDYCQPEHATYVRPRRAFRVSVHHGSCPLRISTIVSTPTATTNTPHTTGTVLPFPLIATTATNMVRAVQTESLRPFRLTPISRHTLQRLRTLSSAARRALVPRGSLQRQCHNRDCHWARGYTSARSPAVDAYPRRPAQDERMALPSPLRRAAPGSQT